MSLARSVAAILALLAWGGCDGGRIASGWREQPIAIDGDVSEWAGASSYFEEYQVKVAVRNDAEFLYVGLSSTDPVVLGRTLLSGLTIWFDPTDRNQKQFGIRFPLGVREMDFDIGADGRVFSPKELLDRYASAPLEFRVMSGENESKLLAAQDGQGIEVAMSGRNDVLTYELRVPLAAGPGAPHAVGASLGSELAIGFEAGKPPRGVLVRERPGRGERGHTGETGALDGHGDGDSDDEERPEDRLDPDAQPSGPPPDMGRNEGRPEPWGRRVDAIVRTLDLWSRVTLSAPPTP